MAFYDGATRTYRRRRSSAVQTAVDRLARLDAEREAIFRSHPDLRALMNESTSLASSRRPRSFQHGWPAGTQTRSN